MGDANERDLRRELQQGRNAGEGAAINDGWAYKDAAGVPRAVQGDVEAPWIKAPPFPAPVQAWFTATTNGTPDLPIGNYVFTPPIDVEQRRVINAWIDFTAQGGVVTSGLSLVPQVFNDAAGEDGEFWNTVVIDPTITVVDLSATVLALPGVGSRLFRPAELRSPLLTNGSRWRVTIPFDVTPYGRFRLAVGALGGAGALVLNYSFAN